MESKPFWQSVGFWGIAATVLAPVGAKYGFDLSGIEVDIVAVVSALVALYGRWRARRPLSLT